ncbi:unnamed protein product [Ascophyllum nodosum]
MAEEARAKTEKLSASEAAQANMVEEASEREEMLAEARQALEAEKMKLGALMSELDDAWGKESQVTEQLAVARSSADGLRDKLASTTKDFAAAKRDTEALEEKVVSITRTLETTNDKVGAVQEAFEQECRKVEEAEAKLQAALSEGEERLSAAEASVEAANSRALEAQRLQDDAEKASTKADRKLKESAKEVTASREEARSSADRLEESEAARSGLTGRVVDLESEIKRLGQALLSDEERASLQSEVDSVRLELAETRETLKAVTARRADLEQELVAIRGETEGYTAKVMELKDMNASLVGHKNSKQRIQQVQKLKNETTCSPAR